MNKRWGRQETHADDLAMLLESQHVDQRSLKRRFPEFGFRSNFGSVKEPERYIDIIENNSMLSKVLETFNFFSSCQDTVKTRRWAGAGVGSHTSQ